MKSHAVIIEHSARRINGGGFSGIIVVQKQHRTQGNEDMKIVAGMGVIAAASLFAAAVGTSWAQTGGDAAAGRQQNSMCVGCHGIEGYKTAFPEVYSVPRLGGQHAGYIVKALQAYKSGERLHPSMKGIAATLSDKDMADLAAYYAAGPAKTASK